MNEKNFTPREIVSELDRFIIGQNKAKKSVSIALRNRWRRRQVADDLRDEIVPKNIIMMGPTGVGKTEIARRLAKLAQAPFIKVEASKFTEVGYVGKDVESMIRELAEVAIKMVREEESEKVKVRAQELAEERLLDLLLPGSNASDEEPEVSTGELPSAEEIEQAEAKQEQKAVETRERLRKLLREGKLDDRKIEIQSQPRQGFPSVEVVAAGSIDEMNSNLRDMFSNIFPSGNKKRKMKVPKALEHLAAEEASRLIDMENVTKNAIERVEQNGIIFLDEVDKIARSSGERGGQGPDVSREGVQRDILPIIEGSTVTTKHGLVRTDHILFIAAGAFHSSKPSDLIPELQGRFPIRVELDSLNKGDFIKILTEPENSLIKQYRAMMDTEGLKLNFKDDAIDEICDVAAEVNAQLEDIGARRLHTVMEKLLEQISFEAPEMKAGQLVIDKKYVTEHLSEIVKDRDLRRYIL
ncbi:MAG: ATP-dependent protease ATPase subunit HslU [Deltaproteobacteria bacterium]|jgi:ATP-dependent HslUV protease ATP-binding subunit HslU|nr:ATP-dependent protease ATPase subunit HslU [Deltaproteobacteria bacterium]